MDCVLALGLAFVALLLWLLSVPRRSALLRNEQRLHALLGSSSHVVLITDATGRILYQSPAATSAWGYPPDSLVARSGLDLIGEDDLQMFHQLLARTAAIPGAREASEFGLYLAAGSVREHEVIATNLLDDPVVAGIVLTCSDITERKAFEQELRHQAFYDPLTSLANRTLFLSRVEHALRRAERSRQSVAVLYLDLDNFKDVNDTLGHQAGDMLLLGLAERLLSCVRREDTVARLGGDEFAILLEENSNLEQARRVASRVVDALREAFDIDERNVYATASIGIAAAEPGTLDATELLRASDLALYHTKSKGKAHFTVFDASMQADALERMHIGNDLRDVLSRDQLSVYFQPIVDLETGSPVEVEALLRWNHPTNGLMPPARFIPLAEEMGLIVPIGRWVLETACRQVEAWQRQFPCEPPLNLSVNVSALQFRSPSFVDDLADILLKTGLDPTTLKLEITESLLVQETHGLFEALERIRNLGVKLAIDDFGTGYASLSYIKRFRVDAIKIDRSFVEELGKCPESTAIVANVIGLARSLGLAVIGEGVETEDQRDQLSAMGCDYGQGYLFSRPITADQVEPMLRPE